MATQPQTTTQLATAGIIASSWDSLLEEISNRAKRDTDRKQNRSRRTEQQILKGALRVFAKDGISRSKIADIAAEAGISTSTFYEYYKSKEELAYDVPMAHLGEFFESYRAAASSAMTARARLILYMTMSADYAREHAEWARLLYLEIWPSVFVAETELLQSLNDFARVIRHLLREGTEEGWVGKHKNLFETSALILGGSNQLVITWLLNRKPRNLTKAGAEFAERIVRLLELEAR